MSSSPVIVTVTFTAADWNGKTWDGSPMELAAPDDGLPTMELVKIIDQHIKEGRLALSTVNSADYAEWTINSDLSTVYGPGDQVQVYANGQLVGIKSKGN